MLSAILPVILVFVIAILLIREFAHRKSGRYHLVRFFALGVASLLMATLSEASGPTRKLMYGLSFSVLICEGYYLAWPNGRHGFISGWMGMLPVIVPVLAFSSYWTMLLYFFGYDTGLLIFSIAAITAYAALSSGRAGWDGFLLNALLGCLSAIMLLWMAITLLNPNYA